jgi:hypothetical protein
LVSKGVFKYGTEKRDLTPQYAYKANDKLYLLAKGVGKDNPSYAVLVFDNSELVETREYPSDALKGLTVGPYDKGITTNYGRSIVVTNHINLADGSVLLCGEAYEDTTPMGTPMGTPKTLSYLSQVFLMLDNQGNLKNNFVVEKVDEESRKGYNAQKLVGTPDNKVLLVGSEKSDNNVYPVMTVIDPASKKATRKNLKDDEVFAIDGSIVYRYLPETGEIIFVSDKSEKNNYTVNATVYKLK